MPLHRIADLTHHLCYYAYYVYPFGMQEPLLDNRLTKTLSNIKCANAKAQTGVYTNMSVYPSRFWREIVKWGILDTVYVSFYGGRKGQHNRMQPGAPYDVVEKNIKRLMRLKHRHRYTRPHVYLDYLVTNETWFYGREAWKKWRNVVDTFAFVRFDSWRGLYPYDVEFEEKIWGPPSPQVHVKNCILTCTFIVTVTWCRVV